MAGGDAAIDTPALGPGCLGPDQTPATVAPDGFAIPDLDAERRTYERFGWTWDASAEPHVPAQPTYKVVDPDIHGDTEGDDLWTYLIMYRRTNEPGYLDRAKAWLRYFEEDYRSCVGGAYADFCRDKDGFGADHLYGTGLIAWYQHANDPAALEEAKQLGAVVEQLWGPDSTFTCLRRNGCTTYGMRQVARHLHFITRLAEVTGDVRWEQLRDKIIDTLLASKDWDESVGMWSSQYSTDYTLGKGAYAAGARITSSFQVGIMSEALDHAYRVTGRPELRRRIVRMAEFVATYGLDPTYQYSGSYFGRVDGKVWHNYSAKQPVTWWDPVYTTSNVNTLVRGYRYTCDPRFLDLAKTFFERGNRGLYGKPIATATPPGVVHHFVDTRFLSPSNFLLAYNKGELRYTYLLFEPVE